MRKEGDPDWVDPMDQEIERRKDLNPFRDYPAKNSVDTVGPQKRSQEASEGAIPAVSLQRVRELFQKRDELVRAYNSQGASEGYQQAIYNQILSVDRDLEAIVGSPDQAGQNIERLKRLEARQAGADSAAKGFGCLLLAGIVSLIGYFAAGPGDTYYLFWGGMACGGFLLLRGLYLLFTNQ